MTMDPDRQQRYADLLEKRIAQLEALVESGSNPAQVVTVNKGTSEGKEESKASNDVVRY